VDLNVADLGRFCRLMREWDTWTVDGWRQSRSALPTDQAMRT
jgi:hypothetical protein